MGRSLLTGCANTIPQRPTCAHVNVLLLVMISWEDPVKTWADKYNPAGRQPAAALESTIANAHDSQAERMT